MKLTAFEKSTFIICDFDSYFTTCEISGKYTECLQCQYLDEETKDVITLDVSRFRAEGLAA